MPDDLMKTSFSTLACPDWNLSQVIAAAVKYGYDGIELRVLSRELDLWTLPELKPSKLSAARKSIEDHGLVVTCIGSGAVFHSADARERQRQFDSVLRMAEIAAGLGAPAIRVFGDRIQSGNTRQQTSEWIAEALVHLAEELTADRLEVWLETHGDYASIAQVSALLQTLSSSSIGVIWDPAQAFEQEHEFPRLAPAFADRVRHVHLKDLVRDEQSSFHYVLTGDGEFPFDTVLTALHQKGFAGFVSFEWEKLWHEELASPEVALPHFMRWWTSRVAALFRAVK